MAESGIEAKAHALAIALQNVLNLSFSCKHVFTANGELLKATNLGNRKHYGDLILSLQISLIS